MSLHAELAALAARVSSPSFPLASEEAVKQSLVLPAVAALGYDTEGLSDIEPEYPAGGGRVDYALLSNGSQVVFVECKRVLGSRGVVQLRSYMAAAGVGVGVLRMASYGSSTGAGRSLFSTFGLLLLPLGPRLPVSLRGGMLGRRCLWLLASVALSGWLALLGAGHTLRRPLLRLCGAWLLGRAAMLLRFGPKGKIGIPMSSIGRVPGIPGGGVWIFGVAGSV